MLSDYEDKILGKRLERKIFYHYSSGIYAKQNIFLEGSCLHEMGISILWSGLKKDRERRIFWSEQTRVMHMVLNTIKITEIFWGVPLRKFPSFRLKQSQVSRV